MRHYCLSSDLVEVARETEVEDQGDNHGMGLGGRGGANIPIQPVHLVTLWCYSK